MPKGEVTLNSITLIRVRLGTERENKGRGEWEEVWGGHAGEVGGRRGRDQAETEDRRHRRREVGRGGA